MMQQWRVGIVAVVMAMVLVGCGSARTNGPYGDDGEVVRNIPASQKAYDRARSLRQEDPEKALILLREALDHDLYNGAAHNDLGVLFMQQGKLYEAAHEFTWARKLLPGHPDPRVNLAIVLDRGGKHADGIEAARAALEVRPGYLPAIKALALIHCRWQIDGPETDQHLAAIVERAQDPSWRDWARRQQLRRGQP